MTWEESRTAKEMYEKELLSLDGVYGVGIGRSGEKDGGYEIFIYSEKPQSALVLTNMREKRISYHVMEGPAPQPDILYVSDIDALSSDEGRYRPVIGGIQLFLQDKGGAWLGTLGTFVKSRNSADKSLYLLSNLHVLKSVGLAVYQPWYGNENVIGAVTKAEEYSNTDAALALVNFPDEAAVNVIEGIGKVAEDKILEKDDIGKRVVKRGRTTGLTEGAVESIDATVSVSGALKYDCVIVRADSGKLFSSSGDSGSPVVLKNENRLAGLHFAGNQTPGGISIFCKVNNVFNNLGVKLPE